MVSVGDQDRDAGSTEQASRGLGDLLQRLLGIASGAGDGAQDFSTRSLAVVRGPQFALQPGILQLEIGRYVRGQRGHSNKIHSAVLVARQLKHIRPSSQLTDRPATPIQHHLIIPPRAHLGQRHLRCG
jgi:hypothetical protein